MTAETCKFIKLILVILSQVDFKVWGTYSVFQHAVLPSISYRCTSTSDRSWRAQAHTKGLQKSCGDIPHLPVQLHNSVSSTRRKQSICFLSVLTSQLLHCMSVFTDSSFRFPLLFIAFMWLCTVGIFSGSIPQTQLSPLSRPSRISHLSLVPAISFSVLSPDFSAVSELSLVHVLI